MLIDGYFANFITSGPKKSTMKPTLIQHILEMADDSPKDQFSILSSVLNNHTYGYPSLKEGGHHVHVKNITYAEHAFYEDKFSKIGNDGERIRTYIPPSPRNRIMYFLDTDKKDDLYQLVKHILKGYKIGLQPHEEIPEMDPPSPPRKKRKHSSRLVSVSQRAVFAEVSADISTQLNCANPNCTLYQLFEEQLITEGTIKWRLHSEN